MSNIKCRAKNPATCRVHGVSNDFAVITNVNLATANLRESKTKCDFASNLEELSEAKQLHAKDQKSYDATVEGLRELNVALLGSRDLTYAEKTEIQLRLKEASAYRQELLASSSTLSPAYNYYDSVVAKHSTNSFVFSDDVAQKEKFVERLKGIPYTAPIVVKTKSGAILYDGAGDGLVPGLKKRTSLFTKPLGFFNGNSENGYISLQNSGINIDLNDVAEIHTLNEDVTSNVPAIDGVVSSDSRFWQVSGDDYSYLFEGEPENPESNDNRWTESKRSTFALHPYNVKSIHRA